MEYTFSGKNYKISKFKTFLTNQSKSQSIETVFQFLVDFIYQNNFEFQDLISILDRYIDYAKRISFENDLIFNFVNDKLSNLQEYQSNDNILLLSNLYQKIDNNYALHHIEENQTKIPDNSKEKVTVLLFKSDLLVENREIDKAFSMLRDCSNQCYDLEIQDSLELKRTIYEKMAILGQIENSSDVALNYYMYYCSFQAGLEFLHFPYLDYYRNFRLTYSIIENPQHEIIEIHRHLKEKNIDINVFNSLLQDFYRTEIPIAFQLENIDIDTFSASNLSVKDLAYYSNQISNLSVRELVATLELITSQKLKNFIK